MFSSIPGFVHGHSHRKPMMVMNLHVHCTINPTTLGKGTYMLHLQASRPTSRVIIVPDTCWDHHWLCT